MPTPDSKRSRHRHGPEPHVAHPWSRLHLGQEVVEGAAAIESLPPPPAPAAAASRVPEPGARPGDDALAERKDGDGGPLAAQRWLLVLRLVRQGV